MSSTYDHGKQVGQQNAHQQATPQRIPNYQQREQFNAELRDGQKK